MGGKIIERGWREEREEKRCWNSTSIKNTVLKNKKA